MLKTARKCKNKSSSAKLSSRSISKAVSSVIYGNVAVRSADHVRVQYTKLQDLIAKILDMH
jgi:hypothetical protein